MSTETEALGQWIIPENSLQPDVVVNKNAETTSQAMVGIVSVDLIADADRVLLQTEYVCSVMVIGDSGTVLTGPVDIEYPALFPRQTVTNNTAETLTLRMDGTTGIALTAGATTTIVAGLADVIEAAVAGGGGGGGASTTQTGECISGLIVTPADGDYRIVVKAPHGGTITEVTTISASGTCTLTTKINTTALGGAANSVSSSEQSQAHASANVFAAGDDLVLTVASNSSCSKMTFTIKYTRTLA